MFKLAASMWWCSPDHVWIGLKWLLVFPRVPATPGTPLHFSQCCSLNDRRRAALLLQNRSPVFSFSLLLPFSYRSSFLSGRYGRNCLLSPPVLLGYNGSRNTRFSPGTTRMMSWPDGERYLRPPQFLVVSLLLSLVSTLLFSRNEGVLSDLNSSTHRFPLDFHRGTCAPLSCSLCPLSSTLQRTQPSVKFLPL